MGHFLDPKNEAARAKRLAEQALDPRVFRQLMDYYEELEARAARPVHCDLPSGMGGATILVL